MMEFLSFEASDKSLILKKAPIPKPGARDVLIKVAYSGICGTDLHIIEGTFPCKPSGPLTLGHEFCGTIEAIGESVQNFQVGQRVAVDPSSACDLCDACHGGSYQLCSVGGINNTIGIFRDGGWATHAVVPDAQVHLVPDGVKISEAALTEPLSCLAHGWDRMNPISVGQQVLILGAGIIGLLWACLLHLHGLRKTVTVSEPQDRRKQIVQKLGLDYHVKNPVDLKDKSFDLVVDCSGSGSAIESAIPLLAAGGRLCIFGVADPKTKITFEPYQMFQKELTFSGVKINPFTFPKGIGLLQAMSGTYLKYENLGIKVFMLSEYKEALDALKKGSISKAVFKL